MLSSATLRAARLLMSHPASLRCFIYIIHCQYAHVTIDGLHHFDYTSADHWGMCPIDFQQQFFLTSLRSRTQCIAVDSIQAKHSVTL